MHRHVYNMIKKVILDSVYLIGNHTVHGFKRFSTGISVFADVHVNGTVDGVDLSELALIIMTLSTPQTMQGRFFSYFVVCIMVSGRIHNDIS